MTVAISVKGLSKKFRLKHQAGGAAYTTFRDGLTDSVKRLGLRLIGHASRSSASVTDEEFWALRDVSFDIQQGEKVGVIGRNGAGKSTLLKLISRIFEPTSGRIQIQGRVASLLEVGTGFHPELTGRENIFFNGAILGMTRAEITRRFDEIVAFAEVEKFLDTPVKYFSSGMYVRLGFAVAAHLEPEILIVDEILAVGDARFQNKCLGKLQDIGRSGRTVMFVSHNMSSILQFTNRTILLQAGQVLLDGNSEIGVREYLRINEDAAKASNLETRVPWFKINSLIFDQKNTEIGFNKPLRLKLDVRLERGLDNVVLMMGIVNSIGARIITAKTSIPNLASGEHTINLEIPEHRLIPGCYFVSLTISVRQEVLFAKDQVILIELLVDNIDDPLLMPHVERGKDRLGSYCSIRASW